jgi:hypothetical protein
LGIRVFLNSELATIPKKRILSLIEHFEICENMGLELPGINLYGGG